MHDDPEPTDPELADLMAAVDRTYGYGVAARMPVRTAAAMREALAFWRAVHMPREGETEGERVRRQSARSSPEIADQVRK